MNYLENIVCGMGGKIKTRYIDIVKQIEGTGNRKNSDTRTGEEIINSIKNQFKKKE